jgi:hypothetical protein
VVVVVNQHKTIKVIPQSLGITEVVNFLIINVYVCVLNTYKFRMG